MKRIDIALLDAGLASSRSRAQALITKGEALVNGVAVTKSSSKVADDAVLTLKENNVSQWVSRGALKLVHALDVFDVAVADKNCVDVGASTGGFTDVLLHNKAAHVVAVDVGHEQLHKSLLTHEKITSLEGTNARHLTSDALPYTPDIIVCDASFISMTKVLPAVMGLAADDAHLIALIKPQFEVGMGNLSKGGLVSKPSEHKAVCDAIEAWATTEMGWHVRGLTPSPITGPKGNMEFLIHCSKLAA